jgi:hypothetical protein
MAITIHTYMCGWEGLEQQLIDKEYCPKCNSIPIGETD